MNILDGIIAFLVSILAILGISNDNSSSGGGGGNNGGATDGGGSTGDDGGTTGGGSTDGGGGNDGSGGSDNSNVVTLLEAPAETTYQRFAILRFEAPNDAGDFQCKYDGANDWTECESPWVIMPPKDDVGLGLHSYEIRACNGQVCGDSVQGSWTTLSIVDLAIADDPRVGRKLQTTDVEAPAYVGERGTNQGWIKGIFRIQCLEVKNLFVDPIVYPGREDLSHLHSIWGNRNIDAYTTDEKLFTGISDIDTNPRSACQGEDINRSGYWVPTLLAPETVNGQRVGWTVIRKDNDLQAIERGLFHETFYYSAIVADVNTIQAPPVGLRMVAGNPSATPSAPADNTVLEDPHYKAHWYCATRGSSSGFSGLTFTSDIPECQYSEDSRGRPNMLLHYVVRFPSCWNGVDLDSDDHISHMAYPVFSTNPGSGQGKTVVCPDTHPIPIPEVSNHFSFALETGVATSKGWRLASDKYIVSDSMPGGHSLHGDWINAWHPEVMEQMIEGCFRQQRDCHNGELGNSPSGTPLILDTIDNVSVPQPAYAPELTNDDMAGMQGTEL